MDSTQNPLFFLFITSILLLAFSFLIIYIGIITHNFLFLTTHIISVGSIVSCGRGGCIWGRGGGVGWGGGAIGSCNYQFLRIRFSPILEVAMMSAISPVQMVVLSKVSWGEHGEHGWQLILLSTFRGAVANSRGAVARTRDISSEERVAEKEHDAWKNEEV